MYRPSLRGRSPKQSPAAQEILLTEYNSLDGRLLRRGKHPPRNTCTWRKCRCDIKRGDCFVAALRLLAPTFLLLFLTSCTPAATEPAPLPVANVYATQATGPWLTEMFTCATASSVTLNMTGPDAAEIVLRLGEPENLATPAYQIDSEEILVVTHRESPVQNLTLDEAQALFAGQGDPSVQVWVYDSAEDVQETFDQLVMAGRSVTSFAKVATSPQQMSDLLNAEKSAVGILPRHWKMGDSRIVFEAGKVPVLAITKSEPQGIVRELLACLQR